MEQKKHFNRESNRIIIFAQEKLGDAILLTPLLKNLKIHFPEIKVDIACFGYNKFFFAADPNVDTIIDFKSQFLYSLKVLVSKNYDILFNPKDHPSFSFLMLTRFIKAGIKIGIIHSYHMDFYNYCIPISFETHIIKKNTALLGFLGIPESDIDFSPYLPQTQPSEELSAFLMTIENKDIVGINLSAGEQHREWSLNKCRELISDIDLPVLIISTEERKSDRLNLENYFEHVVKSPITRNIFEAGLLISKLKLLITPDTSLVHIASCYNIPLIGLYRSLSIHYMRFAPFHSAHKMVISNTPHLEDIPVYAVLNAYKQILGAYSEVVQ